MTDSEENRSANTNTPRVPWWMYVVLILCMVPGLTFPFMGALLGSPDPIVRGLTWFYPVYTLVSGLLAWQCYGRRTYLSWIILVLLLLSHACFYYMAFSIPTGMLYR